jgi:uncharacterized protein (TIGR03083 family)
MVRKPNHFGTRIVLLREAPVDRCPAAPLSLDAVWAAVDRERRELADLLDGLSDQQWDTPSLCAGWRVREVVAHLTLAHMRPGRAALEAALARGSFDEMVRATAVRRAAAAPRSTLVADLRAMVGSRRRAPLVTPLEPLVDVLVHGQDVALPLGLPRSMPVEAATAAATRVWTTGWPLSRAFHVRRRLSGLRLVADDVDWAVGDGVRVEAPVEALLLVLTGRSSAVRERLSGPGAAQLVGPAPPASSQRPVRASTPRCSTPAPCSGGWSPTT